MNQNGLRPEENKSIQPRIVALRAGGYKIVDIDDSLIAGPFRTRKNAQARINQMRDLKNS